MTVSELKELLETLPDDMQVVMSSDSEGNTYSPLSSYEIAVYVPYGSWSGYIVSDGDTDGDGLYPKALVLYPTN